MQTAAGSALVVPASPKGKRVRRSRGERRAIVEETLRTGCSVAEVARRHGVNANQVFLWRRLHAQGMLVDDGPPRLVPVKIGPPIPQDGSIEIGVAEVRLRIEGKPDLAVLRAVLDRLLG